MVAFLVLLGGFTFSGYFLFGVQLSKFDKVTGALLEVIKMVCLTSNIEELRAADIQLGWIYFVIFHLSFLIFQQILYAMLICGYDLEKDRIEKLQEAEKYPLRKFFISMRQYLRDYSRFFLRFFIWMQQLLIGPPGTIKTVNMDGVNQLRDRRKTQQRKRNVKYEERINKDGLNENSIADDVTLQAKWPCYPDGMMHYYVTKCKQAAAMTCTDSRMLCLSL